MNASGASGFATIHIEAERGVVAGEIRDNQIRTSNRGGIELLSLQPPLELGDDEFFVAGTNIQVAGNHITNPGGAYSQFGIKWHAPDLLGPGDTFVILPGIEENTILARGGNLQVGIELHADENTQGDSSIEVSKNTVDGCGQSGMVFRADGYGPSSFFPEMIINLTLNVIVRNNDSGVRMIWDERNHPADRGRGYLMVSAEGNNIADNGDSGFSLHNLDDASAGGLLCESNTVVHNDLGGIAFVNIDSDPLPATVFTNKHDLVYANNPNGSGGNGPQVTGLTASQLTSFEAGVTFSNWQGLGSCVTTCSDDNIDEQPLITPDLAGIYHLAQNSPCVDAGDGMTGKMEEDIDGELREQDGDCDGTTVVDIGADEYPDRWCLGT